MSSKKKKKKTGNFFYKIQIVYIDTPEMNIQLTQYNCPISINVAFEKERWVDPLYLTDNVNNQK